MWILHSGLLVVAMYAAAIAATFHAARTARTPQGAVGWVVFLISMPFLAVPLYLFLGHHRLKGYLIARRDSSKAMDVIRRVDADHAPAKGSIPHNLGPFEFSAGFKAVTGNGGELLIDGQATFDAIFAAIDAAQNYVLVQFYIIHDDELGRALRGHLIAAVKRGVTVRVMTDAVGSYGLPESYYASLRDAGVSVIDPRKTRRPGKRFQINYRNHRKTVIIDGQIGFTGGLNVGDEYMGRDPKFGHWRDTHMKLTGPIVTQLQLIFAEDWHWASKEVLVDDLTWQTDTSPMDATALIVATGPGDEAETGSMLFLSAIAEAKHRLWLASPYFIPDMAIIAALRHAALRGVDVRILVPDAIDHQLPWLAAFSFFEDVTDVGVRVFRYTDGFLHQKIILVDDSLAAVGTTNLDNRSFRLNFECMAVFFDTRIAGNVDQMLRQDFQTSYELTDPISAQSPKIRYGSPVARLFAPLL